MKFPRPLTPQEFAKYLQDGGVITFPNKSELRRFTPEMEESNAEIIALESGGAYAVYDHDLEIIYRCNLELALTVIASTLGAFSELKTSESAEKR